MASYEAALNASNAEAVTYRRLAGRRLTVRRHEHVVLGVQAYDAVFKAITLKVKFTIAELVVMSPQWAFVWTNSAGMPVSLGALSCFDGLS
jgi:hypothetical protein